MPPDYFSHLDAQTLDRPCAASTTPTAPDFNVGTIDVDMHDDQDDWATQFAPALIESQFVGAIGSLKREQLRTRHTPAAP